LKHILVVDDEPTICELVADTLRESGFSVDTAPNGAEALERMRRHLPHAMVLDLMMPRLDATGLVARMRLEPRFASVPILIVTASYGAHEAAEQLGANALLTKPFELDELVAVIGALADQASAVSAPAALHPSLAAET
jgi:DNA-binding response OmpR family regulator